MRTKKLAKLIAILPLTALMASPVSFAQGRGAVADTSIIQLHGYVQTDIQGGERDATLDVGKPNKNAEKLFGRMGIRRGYFTLSARHPKYRDWSAVGTVDINDRGVFPFQAYVNYLHQFDISDTELSLLEIGGKAGLDIPSFGLEERETSDQRLSPERAAYISNMYPDVVDLGVGMHFGIGFGGYTPTYLQHSFGLDIQALSGNGLGKMRKDVPDVLFDLRHSMSNIYLDILYGASYYWGYVPQGNELDKKVRRDYLSVFARFGFSTVLGYTRLSAEYISGNQPGKRQLSHVVGQKIGDKEYYDDKAIFSRGFQGAMGEVSHRFYFAPIGLLYKYYYYNKRDLITNDKELWQMYLDQFLASPEADGKEQVHGFGLQLFLLDDALRLTAYYEMPHSERVPNPKHPLYRDPSDDKLTLRLQYRF
ncbi:hypothetical protein HQ45_01640 [Porphyromonas crevioricanis]|uniref:Phosphate-selective porin n=2 Tax=Porphyromonas crevioricanis TaxID=393921 RepID=A0A0A2FL74_9PORP|nr:hypothetical protein [Porphyromonas crevioricanis]KGN90847.1 hypothetical protein HQ45_01640 [Porphyromonas crevioricanis]SJZ53068.1 hypothetical protein SAMN02745203_00038 [Porphyromonas crevioricanis]SQH73235.1 Uncharacterised protein [Porphyromonas crevioricanis]GAD05264.1 hypothetical protein PORCRE_964 [Porphyromonas crevioricanis JCM 15906]GAD06660.1 hypothetical protein PORCAN_258 [Porphyromonas crevioricanis JCM 13913]